MKVEQSAIKRYKTNKWYNVKERTILYGVTVIMSDGKSYNVSEGKAGMFFIDKNKAIKKVKLLNAELKNKKP